MKFHQIIYRLYPEGAPRDVDILFSKLAQRVDLGVNERIVVDLRALLFLLEIATGDSRRAYEDKTSLIATDVEFWNKFERHPSPHTPNTKARKIISSKGYIYGESFTPRTPCTLASLLQDDL